MKKIDKHIEIVRSTRFNTMGRESSTAIFDILCNHYSKVGISVVDSMADLEQMVQKTPDLVFTGLKRLPSRWGADGGVVEEIWLSDYLELHGISYTGSSKQAVELDMNKADAKLNIQQAGLATAPYFTAFPGEHLNTQDIPLEFPLFVKPINAGGGQGIDANSLVYNFSEFEKKVAAIFLRYKVMSLVEEYLPGREFSVGILKEEHTDEYSVMPIEMMASPDENGRRTLGNLHLRSSTVKRAIVDVSDEIIRAKVVPLAIEAFHSLGARDYGRIDIRLDESGIPHFLEANLLPGIRSHGTFPTACKLNIGLDHEAMILSIVRLGLARTAEISVDETDDDETVISPLEPVFEPI